MDEDHNEDLSENGITLVAKYGKTQHVLANLPPSTTILEVKSMLSDLTRILPKRQKLIGLVTVKSSEKVSDETPLSMLTTKTNAAKKKAKTAQHELLGHQRPQQQSDMSFILMGTPEEEILIDPMDRDDLPEVIDDFDFGLQCWVDGGESRNLRLIGWLFETRNRDWRVARRIELFVRVDTSYF